jgi:hypothetical protein
MASDFTEIQPPSGQQEAASNLIPVTGDRNQINGFYAVLQLHPAEVAR